MNDITTYPLFDEMCNEYQRVLDAKDNAKAWNQEANRRMRNVRTLIQTQRKLDPNAPDQNTFIDEIKRRFNPVEQTEPDTTAETPNDGTIGPENNTEDSAD